MTNTPDTYDWPTIRDIASRDLSKFITGTRMPDSVLYSKNFMADERLGLVYIDGKTIEIATGMFMGKRIYGVTFDRVVDSQPDERDTSEHNWTAVMDYLNKLAGLNE